MKIKMAKSVAMALLVCGGGYNLLSANETTKLDDVQVVTSAAGYEQKITDAPASISVITQEDLQKKPYNNLLDAVKDIEGVDIGETNDKTNNGSVSIRGMGDEYTLLLIDGKRQNNNGDLYPNSFGGVQYASIPPLSMVERIEVIRGPMGTIYGSDAIGGVVNIITKKISSEWTGSIGYAKTFQTEKNYGNDDRMDFAIMGPIIKDKLGIGLRGSFFDVEKSNPEYKKLEYNGVDVSKANDSFGGGKGNVQHQDWTAGAGLTFTPTENHTIKLDYDVAKQKYDNQPYLAKDGRTVQPLGSLDQNTVTSYSKNNNLYDALGNKLNTNKPNDPGYVDAGSYSPRIGYLDELRFQREQYSAFWEADWALGKSTIGVHHIDTKNNGRTLPLTADERRAYNKYLDDNVYTTPYFDKDGKPVKAGKMTDTQEEEVKGQFLPRKNRIMESKNTTYSAKYEVPLSNHFLVVGAEYQDSELKDGVFGMETGESDLSKKYYQYALYAEDTWNIIDPLMLTFGARYNKHEDFGDNVSPRVYLSYAATDNWTFKGGVSTGYKTPKATDLYDGVTGFGGQGTSPMYGNPDLKPEKSVSYEAAVYYQHDNGHNANLTLFQNDFKDKIQSVTLDRNDPNNNQRPIDWAGIAADSYSQKQNIGKATIKGVELAGKFFILDNLSIKANWTYLDSEEKETKTPLRNSAKHMYNAMLDYQITSKFGTYLQYSGEIDRFRGTYTDNNGETKNRYFEDFSIWNLGASYQFTKDFILIGRVNNLLDKDYLKYSVEDRVGSTTYYKDYNNKPAGRNFWVSARYTF